MFVCTGLLVYWVARTALLLRGNQEQIADVLQHDLWWARRTALWLRLLLTPAPHFSAPR